MARLNRDRNVALHGTLNLPIEAENQKNKNNKFRFFDLCALRNQMTNDVHCLLVTKISNAHRSDHSSALEGVAERMIDNRQNRQMQRIKKQGNRDGIRTKQRVSSKRRGS